MAKCPQCGQKIKPWYVKAECPNCGVNMVNYNWEERLEEDSVRAEEAFRKLHINVAKMKYSFAGTKLRIARIPISVFPLFSFLLPLVNVSLSLPFYDSGKTLNIISIVMNVLNFNFGAIPAYLSSDLTGDAALMLVLSIVLLVVSALSLIVTLVFFILNFIHFRSPGMFICNLFGAGGMLGSAFCFNRFCDIMAGTTINAFSGSLSFGAFVGAGLFLVAAVFNLLVSLKSVNVDFEEIVRVQEEKEKEEEERIILERKRKVEEDKKRLESERAEAVRQAEERLRAAEEKELSGKKN